MVSVGARDPADVTGTDVPVRLDVTSDGQVAAAVEYIDAAAGRLDVLVNNRSVIDW